MSLTNNICNTAGTELVQMLLQRGVEGKRRLNKRSRTMDGMTHPPPFADRSSNGARDVGGERSRSRL